MSYFNQLSHRRDWLDMGPKRLSRWEIRLWEEDEGVQLERWERRAILALDDSWFASQQEAIASANPPKK